MNYNQSQIKGLSNLCEKLQKLENAVKDFKDRHFQLKGSFEKADKKNEQYDAMQDLPGLMSRQESLKRALQDAGINHILKKVIKDSEENETD